MKLRAPHVCVPVLTLMAPALVHAQFGGLLKKKAAAALSALRDRKPPYEKKARPGRLASGQGSRSA